MLPGPETRSEQYYEVDVKHKGKGSALAAVASSSAHHYTETANPALSFPLSLTTSGLSRVRGHRYLRATFPPTSPQVRGEQPFCVEQGHVVDEAALWLTAMETL